MRNVFERLQSHKLLIVAQAACVSTWRQPTSNTMLKHLGGSRAAGGEQPPMSEGGSGASAYERGYQLTLVFRMILDDLKLSYQHT